MGGGARDGAIEHDWKIILEQKREPSEIATSHKKHLSEDTAYIAAGRKLVSVYREHIAAEEEGIYSAADKVLSGKERFAVMQEIQAAYGDEAITSLPEFDKPQFSDPSYQVQYFNTGAQSENVLDAEYEVDDDDEGDTLQ